MVWEIQVVRTRPPPEWRALTASNAAGQGGSAVTVNGVRGTATGDQLSAQVSLPRSESRGPVPPPARPARDHMPFWRADSYAGNATCAAARVGINRCHVD